MTAPLIPANEREVERLRDFIDEAREHARDMPRCIQRDYLTSALNKLEAISTPAQSGEGRDRLLASLRATIASQARKIADQEPIEGSDEPASSADTLKVGAVDVRAGNFWDWAVARIAGEDDCPVKPALSPPPVEAGMVEAILNIEMVPATAPNNDFDRGWDASAKAYRKEIRRRFSAAPKDMEEGR